VINKDEIKKILETIDVFKILSIKAESEKKEFARITFIWSIILFLTFTYYGFKFTFLDEISWFYITLFGAFLSTIKSL